VPSAGQWLAFFEGIPAGNSLEEQALAGQTWLLDAGVTDEEVHVVNALDLSGSFLVQTPLDVDESALVTELQTVPGFIFAQGYDAPGTPEQPFVGLEASMLRERPDPLFGPFAPLDAIVNNNTGSTGTANFTQSQVALGGNFEGSVVVAAFFDSGSAAASPNNKFTGFARSTNAAFGPTTFTDGGTLPVNNTLGDAGDAVMARNTSFTGRTFLATMQFSGAGINVFRSDNAFSSAPTMSWLSPVQGAPGKTGLQDKPWIAVDSFGLPGSGNGNVYLVERDFGPGNGIYFFRSIDNGNSFGPSGGTLITTGGQGANVVVGTDHAVYVFWYNGPTLMMRKSVNQGVSFGAPVTVASGLAGGVNGDLGLVGQNNGETFTRPIRTNAFPQPTVNPINGHLYVTYANDGAGADKADIFIVSSTDGGATWGAPFKVNDDATTTDQWNPAVAVTADGARLGIFYYSRQVDTVTTDGDPVNNQFRYYGRIGAINGSAITFAPSFAVSDVNSKPEVGRDAAIAPDFMGDYNQAVGAGGLFVVAWSDNRTLLPGGGTRMDPNVQFDRIVVPFSVTTTVPAVNSAVTTRPTSFTVNLTTFAISSTIQASDFKVNGIAANSVTQAPGGNALTFTYATSPVTVAEGPQTMHIDAGAVTRQPDGAPLAVFDGTFYYDTTALAVTTTSPAAGSVFTVPGPVNLTLTFNEAINPASLTASDLIVGGIPGVIVSGVTFGPGNTSATFAITGANSEGTLSVSLPAAAITDAFGNPSRSNFSATFTVDVTTVAFPVPLTAVLPVGSLIYTGTTTGAIHAAGDTDRFTINVGGNPRQTLTIIVTRTSGNLNPTIGISPAFGGQISGLPPGTAMLQTSPIDGVQTITIGGGIFNTTGGYTVQIYLNASVQGPPNTSRNTALVMNNLSMEPGSSIGRYAAIGNVVAAAGPDFRFFRFAVNGGEHNTIALKTLTGTMPTLTIQDAAGVTVATGVAGTANLDRIVADFVAPAGGNFFAVVSGLSAASFSLIVTPNGDFEMEPNDTFATAQNIDDRRTVFGYATSKTTIESFEHGGVFTYTFTGANNAITLPIAKHDGNSGLRLSSPTDWMYRNDAPVQVKQGDVISWWAQVNGSPSTGRLNLGFGASAAGALSLVLAGDTGQLLFQNNAGFGAVTIGTPVSQTWLANHWYRMEVTWGVGGQLTGRVYDSDGTTLLNTATATNNDITSGGIGFRNNGFQAFVDTVVRYPAGPFNDDWYAITVADTDHPLHFSIATPSRDFIPGPQAEFINFLAAKMELYDPAGQLLDSDFFDIEHEPTVAGVYRLRVTGDFDTRGEYVMTYNFRPHITSVSATPIDENGTTTLTVTFTALGVPLSHGGTIRWGDESSTNFTVDTGVFTFTRTHRYLDNPAGQAHGGTYSINVNMGLNVDASATVVVNNVAPANVVLTPTAAILDENGTTTINGTFTDPGTQDTHTVTINWGDGSPNTVLNRAAGVLTFSASHQYLDNPSGDAHGTFTITATVTDKDGESGSGTTSIQVDNVAPTITSLTPPAIINENDTHTLTGTFHDAGPLDTHTVLINWGPGEGSTTLSGADLISLGNGEWSFSANHQFLDDNPTATASDVYTISVTVTDDDLESGSDATTVTVNNVAPSLDPIAGPTGGVRGQSLTFTANFLDVGTLDTHTAVWNFGDGTGDFGPTNVGQGVPFSVNHNFTASGTYTISVTIADDDGGVSVVTHEVVISAIALQPDPLDPTKAALVIGGTTADDFILITPGIHQGDLVISIFSYAPGSVELIIGYFSPTATGCQLEVTFGGATIHLFTSVLTSTPSRLIAHAQDGDDNIQVAGSIDIPAWLYGDAGDDRLNGGKGHNVLLGGDGDDHLLGGQGRDLMIGGDGEDRIIGNSGDDILIGGRTAFDFDESALAAAMAEWTSARDYNTRVANLRGLGAGPRANGNIFLIAGGPNPTVLDDAVKDILTGSSGLDWFFGQPLDVLTDQHGNESNG